MPTTITSAGITFNDTTSLTSANGVPSALKLTTARTINGVSFDGTANITVPASGTSAAKAWVNFDGTAAIGTLSIIGKSFNVSSVTKTAVGKFTIAFPVGVFSDANYSVLGTCQDMFRSTDFAAGNANTANGSIRTTTSCLVTTSDDGGGGGSVFRDSALVNFVFFGN